MVVLKRFPLGFQPQFLPVDVSVFRFLPRDTLLQLPYSEGGENVGQGHHGLIRLGVNNLQLDVHVGGLFLLSVVLTSVNVKITRRSIVTENISEVNRKFCYFCCIDLLTWIERAAGGCSQPVAGIWFDISTQRSS